MSRRLLLLIVVVIVICYVAAVSLGYGGDGNPTGLSLDLQAPSAGEIRNRLTVKFKSEEITVSSGADDGCRVLPDRIIVPVDTDCELTMKASPMWTKQLLLVLAGGGRSVDLELEQDNALTVDKTLEAGQAPVPFDVYRHEDEAEATLTIDNCDIGDSGDDTAVCDLEMRK